MPYFVLGVAFWWPACQVAVVLALAGWRGRSGVGAFATIGESAVDLYGRMLAVQLGLAPADGGPLLPEVGEAITRALRKNR